VTTVTNQTSALGQGASGPPCRHGLQQHQLPVRRFPQAAHAQTQQPQRVLALAGGKVFANL